ncbi:class I SAM-dependent methyltransferase [Ancylobacter pratisalsi]|uniref:Class I SAM-dependent methyltransferase n=1 Tax=Ancylobacter pratisalsi TaxID=1745854 RepID=A0A6P1YR01_9HYPH|nr:class I SAM-dependent methyltransferase [Ancylobacter pratisalsi]QIB34483.1 class I SAM-dependent methyltransferase [Ancylobacter pratisalsi]
MDAASLEMPTTNTGIELNAELREAAAEEAAKHDVSAALHRSDHLLGYMLSVDPNPALVVRGYILSGSASARQVVSLVEDLGLADRSFRLMEFAAGYGRVTRHLKSMLPRALYFAADIHPEACAFLSDEMGVVARLSSADPESCDVGDGYDLVFATSFFSHIPDVSFGRWLRVLYDSLAPGGYLMFTTHGAAVIDSAPDFWNGLLVGGAGYGYHPFSDQADLPVEEYGTALTLPNYVSAQISAHLPGARLMSFTSGAGTPSLEDEWVVAKPAQASPGSAG